MELVEMTELLKKASKIASKKKLNVTYETQAFVVSDEIGVIATCYTVESLMWALTKHNRY